MSEHGDNRFLIRGHEVRVHLSLECGATPGLHHIEADGQSFVVTRLASDIERWGGSTHFFGGKVEGDPNETTWFAAAELEGLDEIARAVLAYDRERVRDDDGRLVRVER